MSLAFHGFPQYALWIAYAFFAIIIALLIAIVYASIRRLQNKLPPKRTEKSKRDL